MRYLYYTLWQIMKLIRTNDTPATNAMFLISLCQMLNLFTIYIIICLYTKETMIAIPKTDSYILFGLFTLVIYTFNYFLLYRKRELFENRYKDESKNRKIFGRLFLGLYFFGTIFLAFIFGYKHSLL